MPELGPYGSVRGARGNSRPYRESGEPARKTALLTQGRHGDAPGERAAKTPIPALWPQVSLQKGHRISDRLGANCRVKSH